MRRDTLGGQLWGEFVGTMILILLGDGVVANVVFASRGVGYDWNTITLGWAFAVAMAVYVAGGITGAHLNPAVTLAAILRRGMNAATGLMYMVAQVAGAFVGAGLVYLVYMGDFNGQGFKNVFTSGPGANYANATMNWYVSEIVGTFALVLFIYAIVDNVRNVGPGANLWPFMVGLAVLSIGLSLGGPTGYAINPARDFGPRLFAALLPGNDVFSGVNASYWLAPIIGPLIGGALGAFFYDFGVTPFLPAPAVAPPTPEGANVEHVDDVGVRSARAD